jgi:hypothetical protein
MPMISVQTTILNPFLDTPGNRQRSTWSADVHSKIARGFQVANMILGCQGIHVQPVGSPNEIDAATSERYLCSEYSQPYFPGGPAPSPALQNQLRQQDRQEGASDYQDLQRRGVTAPHQLQREYWVGVSGVSSFADPNPVGQDALQILALTHRLDCVQVYWVPGMRAGAGVAVMNPPNANVNRDLEGIFIAPHGGPTTLAHELGHLLMRCGHCIDPEHHQADCPCAPADNLMGASEEARNIPSQGDRMRLQFFTGPQAARMLARAALLGYMP